MGTHLLGYVTSHPRTHHCGKASHMFHIFSIECAFHWFNIQAKDSVVILYTCFSPHSQNTMEESSRPGEKASLLQKLLSEWTRPRSTFMPFSVWGQLVGEWEVLVLWWVVHRCCKSKQRLKSTILPLMFQDDCRIMKKEGICCSSKDNTIHIYKYIYILIITRYQINSVQWNICLKLLQSALILN